MGRFIGLLTVVLGALACNATTPGPAAVKPPVGTGQTMKQAQTQVYSRIKNILIPNMYYRTDIGDRWAEDSDKLHNWGYLR